MWAWPEFDLIAEMTAMKALLKRLWQEEKGNNVTDYALLLLLLSLAAMGAMGALGGSVGNLLGHGAPTAVATSSS
jgi:Flp pilus assembly pilin Flp